MIVRPSARRAGPGFDSRQLHRPTKAPLSGAFVVFGQPVPSLPGMARRPTPDPYVVLGLPRGASDDEIRSAYRNAMKAAHPDRGGDPEAAARVNEAYALLSDPKRRAAHTKPPTPTVRRPAAPPSPKAPPRAAPPPSSGNRSWWPAVLIGAVGLLLVAVVVGSVGGRPDSADDDSPFFLSAEDCVDVDQLVPTDVPCESERSDGRVIGESPDGTCPDGLSSVESSGRTLCVDLDPVFEVEGCVAIDGNVVTPADCGPNPDGIVSGLVGDEADCPLGTAGAARLDDGTYVCVVIP